MEGVKRGIGYGGGEKRRKKRGWAGMQGVKRWEWGYVNGHKWMLMCKGEGRGP